MTEKENKRIAQRERSRGQKVAKGIAIALIVIAAFWGLFAAPVVAMSGGAGEAVIGLLVLALVFFLLSMPFLYLGRKRKEKIITVTTAKKEEEEEGGEEEKRGAKQRAKNKKPERADYPDDESFENAMMRYLQDTDQVSRPDLEPLTREQLYGNRTPPPQPQSTEPQLIPGEQVLWRRDLTKGIFRKQIIETQMITNRAIRINQQALDLSVVDDIQVTNKHSRSEGSYTSYGRYGVRMGSGTSRSRHYGDIVFFSRGQIVFRVLQVEDPHGVVRLVKAAMKEQA